MIIELNDVTRIRTELFVESFTLVNIIMEYQGLYQIKFVQLRLKWSEGNREGNLLNIKRHIIVVY